MKKSGWVLYLFESEDKIELFKIMEFKTIKELGYVIGIETSTISNWFHGFAFLSSPPQRNLIDDSLV